MPVTETDYYGVLGVNRNADADEIKREYKKLAKKYHPDRNADDAASEQRFKEISEAYSVLKDDEKRALYDKYGHEGLREGFDADAYEQYRANAGFGGRGGAGGFESFFGGGRGGGVEFDLNDLFGGGAGGGAGFGRRSAGPRARDLTLTLGVGFEQAIDGFTTSFSYRRPRPCRSCSGTGRHGNGICPTCRGGGAVEEEKSVTVKVPQGAESGDKLRLRGKGAVGVDGRKGDVLLELRVGDHPTLRREGLNLVTVADVTPVDLLVGGKVDVTTLKGGVTMTVPAGFDPSKRLRIGGKGVTRKGATGDLLVELKVTPLELDGRARELAEALKSELDGEDGA